MFNYSTLKASLRRIMTRRDILALGKNSFIYLFLGGLLGGCGLLERQMTSISQLASKLAFLLGYLLYEDNPPIKSIEEIENHLKTILQNSPTKRQELEKVYHRIGLKNKNISFETSSSENKRGYFKKIMPILVNSSVILEILRHYLRGDRILEYLDYTDLPGDYGECGWILTEGAVWDRYYSP